MEFWETITNRHSIRDFRPEPVERATIERLIEAARRAPSAMNEQPWRFTVLQGASRARLGSVIAQSTVHLSEYMDVLGPDRYEAAMQWYSSLGDAPVLVVVSAPRSDSEFGAMNRYLSVGAAIENLMLAACDAELGACNITFSFWVRDDIADLVALPETDEVLSIIALGHPSEIPPVIPPRTPADTTWLD